MSIELRDLIEGEARKADALDLLSRRRHAYVLRGRRALLETLLAKGEATADDVRDVVELPEGVDPKLFGAVPAALVNAGIIARGGYASTSRPAAHARPVTRWVLADRAAAERWLAQHPDPGGPAPPPRPSAPAQRQRTLW